MTYCSNCGAAVSGPFCGECGTPAAAPSTPSESAHAPTESRPTPAEPRPAPAEPARPATDEQAPASTDRSDRTETIAAGGALAGSSAARRSVTPPRREPTVVARSMTPQPEQPARQQTMAAPARVVTPVAPPAAPTGAHPEQAPTRNRKVPLIVGGAALLALALGGGAYAAGLFGGGSPAPTVIVTQTVTPSASATPTATETPSATPTPTATATPTPTPTAPAALSRDQAYTNLENAVAADRAQNPVRGQWVAQLASKTEGIVDTSQKPTPFSLVDIWTEVDRHKHNSEYGSKVRVVHSGDWAGSTPNAQMWVTFVDLDASSKAQVQGWCEAHYEQRGKALLNICYPRQMRIS